MFRSRCTFAEYQNSLQNETAAAEELLVDDADGDDDSANQVLDENDENNDPLTDLDPSLVPVPEGFNDDDEVLVIDGQGTVSKLRGRITVKVVHGLDVSSRILVPLNKFLQPVKKAGSVFNRFLADVAKRPRFCPLNYKEWRLVPSLFKDRIINYIRKKFVMPATQSVHEKVLSAVGERVRGHKRYLRMKYIKEGTTKEELYALPAAESGNTTGLKRPCGVGDTMWFGFVDLCFSEKFQKYSEIGKRARGKQLHPHTAGSQSFAILREKFERKHNREPGPIEWFIETRQNKKDKTFHDPITQQFVDSAKNIIKQKIGSDEVVFSESTKQVENIAYRKLMGAETQGKVWGLGRGVSARDLRNLRYPAESPIVLKLLNKVQTLENQLEVLNAKVGAQALATPHDLCTSSQEVSRNAQPCDKNKGQDSPICDGSQKGSRPDTPVDLDRSNDSPKSGDAFSISNVLGHETQRSTRPSKHIDSIQGGHQKQSGKTLSLSKQSNGNIRTESLNHGNKRPNPVQPSSTLLNNGGVIANAQPSKHITFNHDGGRSHEELSIKANPTSGGTLTKGCKPSLHSHAENQKRTFVGMDKQVKNTPVISSHMLQKAAVEHGTAIRQEKNCLTSLSRAQVDILVDTVLRNHPKEVHQYRSSEKKELIVFYLAGVAMGICKRKAEPSMLDMVLREKLDEITLVTTKRNVQREEIRNGGNVGP